MRTTEGFVHLAVRDELKRRGWLLIAGQYPGGSDDECCALNIMDPVLARDRSPDPRRHSENKLVPDLIALRGRYLLIIEMKPSFSAGDLKKLRTLLGERKPDFLMALERFATERNCRDLLPLETLRIVPALGFSRKSRFSRETDVCYFLVTSLEKVEVLPPLSICPEGESLDDVAAEARAIMRHAVTKEQAGDIQRCVDGVDWNCKDANTRYITHGIHRYSGKFIPQIARHALEIVSLPWQTILDPYCGSGTTPLEASILGRRAIGMDMNPLAVLIAKVKCTPVSPSTLSFVQQKLTKCVRLIVESQDGPSLFPSAGRAAAYEKVSSDLRWRHEWYRKWFDENCLWQLIAIHQEITSLSDEDSRNIALVAFSDILRRCSHAHSGYPNVMYDKRRLPRPFPSSLFLDRLHEICESVTTLVNHPMRWKPTISLGDARKTGLDDESVDAIVTHPPYIGSVPYAEYGVLSLTWLGHDPKDLDRRLTGGRRQSPDVVERFRDGYGAMLKEAWRVLKKKGHCFLVVGNPLVKGCRVNLETMTIGLAAAAGFEVAAKAKRAGVNRRANLMGEENLLFLQKP